MVTGISVPEMVQSTLVGMPLSAVLEHPLIPEDAIITSIEIKGTANKPKVEFFYRADAIPLSACFPIQAAA